MLFRSGGYLNPDIWIRFPQEKLFFHEGIFQYPVLKNLNSSSYSSNLTLPLEYLKQALGESIPAVRLFALNYLRKNNLTELVPSILTGFLNEEEDFLIKKYGQLLRSDLYQDKVPKNVPSSFLVKVQNYWETSVDLDHKANALFFAVQYTQFRPEPEIPILITMMDNGYPLKFLVRMFSAYPLHHLEAFITPFQQGYGDKWELILEIFLHFPSSEPILKAMFHALENRQEAHFASFQNKIIAAWERVSGITFEGETAVYQHWMQNQFKH